MSESAQSEFQAIQAVYGALEKLDDAGKTRVLAYIASLLGLDAKVGGGRGMQPIVGGSNDAEEAAADEAAQGAPTFATLAELYAAASPKSNGEKALVAGYWLQVCQGADSFTGAGANKALNDLGHKVANITDAIDSMKKLKPMLILQLKKSGTTRQARKLYKLSHEGEKRVEEMISG